VSIMSLGVMKVGPSLIAPAARHGGPRYRPALGMGGWLSNTQVPQHRRQRVAGYRMVQALRPQGRAMAPSPRQ
jgi:hypothetical protein